MGEPLSRDRVGRLSHPWSRCTLGLLARDTGEEVNGQVRCGADGAGGLKELLSTSLKSIRLRYR
jgi:hypothetical protein